MDTSTLIFEAAVSAHEEEADFVPVSIAHGFRWTSRTSGGPRFAVGRLLNGGSHLRQRGNSSCASLLLTHDDEFVSVDLRKVSNIFLTQSSGNLRSVRVDIVGSLTRRAKLTVTLEIVQADVKLGARGGELAGAVHTVALVVMWADLRKQIRIILQQQLEQLFLRQIMKTMSFQKLCIVWRSQSMGTFTLESEAAVSAHIIPAQV